MDLRCGSTSKVSLETDKGERLSWVISCQQSTSHEGPHQGWHEEDGLKAVISWPGAI